MSGSLDGRFCRRCLLEESGEAAYARTVAEYVKALTPAVRVPEAEYRRRLSACLACEKLANGMCALCGCFVELRAAKRVNSCPDSPPRWTQCPEEELL